MYKSVSEKREEMVKFRREILVKDTHLGNLSIQIVFRAMRLLLQIVLKMPVMCQSFC